MLFEARLWPGLRDGSVTLTFRRWRRPHARVGSRHRTPVGVLIIDAVDPIDPARIDDRAARRAGHPDRAALLRALDVYGTGVVYRVAFHYAGADPRVALRGAARPSEEEWTRVTARLARLDAGRGGAWTLRTLRLIRGRPGVRAAELAEALGRETLALKVDVRKLKELGLTESLEVGYRLSPRGRALLRRLAVPTRSARRAGAPRSRSRR